MRPLFLTISNLLRLLLALLALPLRLLRRRRRPRYVRFRLTGDPPYRRRPRRGLPLFRSRVEPATVTSLEVLREQLELLARDPGIRGVLFELEDLSIPIAKRQALAELFALARKAGKEVIAYAVMASTSEYALMCAADRIWLAPAGRLDLSGFSAEATAIGRGLKQLGIAAHFLRRGDYKTAPELFTREVISDVQRQTLEKFLDERYADLLEAVAKRRKLSGEAARRKIDEGPYSARRALAEGLCDALCARSRLSELLGYRENGAEAPEPGRPGKEPAQPGKEPAQPGKEAPGGAEAKEARGGDEEGPPRLGTFESWAYTRAFPPRLWRPLRRRTRLAMVAVNGMISQGEGGMSLMGRTTGSETLARALRAAARDPRARAIVLFINCPGGSSVASEAVLEEVQRAARKKPIVAYFDRVAASGGYMVALGAKELWAGPHAIVGSIGVFAGKFDAAGLLERLGVQRLLLTRGENAGLGTVSRGFTPHERAALELEIEDTYQAFLEHVAEARKLSKEEVHQRAEGRIYSGTAAVEAGLVDGTCGFEQACRRALLLAGAETERFEVSTYTALPRRLSLPGALLQWGPPPGIYALWDPWITLPGMEGAGEPG